MESSGCSVQPAGSAGPLPQAGGQVGRARLQPGGIVRRGGERGKPGFRVGKNAVGQRLAAGRERGAGFGAGGRKGAVGLRFGAGGLKRDGARGAGLLFFAGGGQALRHLGVRLAADGGALALAFGLDRLEELLGTGLEFDHSVFPLAFKFLYRPLHGCSA